MVELAGRAGQIWLDRQAGGKDGEDWRDRQEGRSVRPARRDDWADESGYIVTPLACK